MRQIVIITIGAVILALGITASQLETTNVETTESIPILAESITVDKDAGTISIVEEVIRMYDLNREDTFDSINALKSDTAEYPFVLDPNTNAIVSHGAFPEGIGSKSVILSDQADRPRDIILNDLHENGNTWVEYVFLDPESGTDQIKRSWLSLHDGYIFGSGHNYLPEDRVKHEVEAAIRLYDLDGKDAFKHINGLATIPNPHYVVVININSAKVVAHGAFPHETVGTKVSQSREGLTDLEFDGSFWLYVQNKNPNTNMTDQKRVWMVPHDGHLFGSGYYYPVEEKVQLVVEYVVELYKEDKEMAFNYVDGLETNDPHYPFVVDPATGKIVSHGAFPHIIGNDSVIMTDRTERLTSDILADLEMNQSTWTDYKFQNPRTGQLEHKRTYLYLHDGHIFGAGFYYSVFGTSS